MSTSIAGILALIRNPRAWLRARRAPEYVAPLLNPHELVVRFKTPDGGRITLYLAEPAPEEPEAK